LQQPQQHRPVEGVPGQHVPQFVADGDPHRVGVQQLSMPMVMALVSVLRRTNISGTGSMSRMPTHSARNRSSTGYCFGPTRTDDANASNRSPRSARSRHRSDRSMSWTQLIRIGITRTPERDRAANGRSTCSTERIRSDPTRIHLPTTLTVLRNA
jgi:hypothetical protein